MSFFLISDSLSIKIKAKCWNEHINLITLWKVQDISDCNEFLIQNKILFIYMCFDQLKQLHSLLFIVQSLRIKNRNTLMNFLLLQIKSLLYERLDAISVWIVATGTLRSK
jgi:hypothetical protein